MRDASLPQPALVGTESAIRASHALVVAHPGHELRVLGWVRATRPLVCTLTDGSGHTRSQLRTALSADVIRSSGAVPGPVFGSLSDREIYRAILEQDHVFFLGLSQSLASLFVDNQIECVVGDAMEGYNPTHDVCRLLIDHAVRRASQKTGASIKNYAFPLTGHPSLPDTSQDSVRIQLDTHELTRKIEQIRSYARSAGGILTTEVEEAFREYGEAAFGQELLSAPNTLSQLDHFASAKPFYETHGEQQVAAGHYKTVIRYREHIAPLARVLLA